MHAEADQDRPGDHWVTINGSHVLIHEPQGTKPAQEQPLSSVMVLGKKVVITYDPGILLRDQLKASTAIAAAADLLSKNAAKFTDDEKKAIGEISSFRVTESPNVYLGATGKRSMTLFFSYIQDTSAPWLASTFGHEGQHYLNAGKYSGADLWRDEQSASKTQLGIGSKIGLSANDQKNLRDWMDDKNRAKMQEHMMKGYTD